MALETEGVDYVIKATDKATQTFRGIESGMERVAKGYQSLLATLGVGVGVGAFLHYINGAIDAADRLNDLSKSTGVAVKDLSGLQLLARQTGTDLEGLAKGINRMSVEMGKDPEKFRALGITAKDNVGAFKQFADIFNLLPDIQQRNALAQAVFAKSWAEMAPALSEGGQKIGETIEKGARLSRMTKELAEQSDELKDKWAELYGTGRLVNSIIGPMLPLLNSLADDMLKVGEKTSATNTEFSVIAETMKVLAILGANISFVFTTMGKDIARAAENVKLIATGDWAGSRSLGEFFRKDAETARKALDDYETKIRALGTAAGKAGKDVANSQLFEFAGGGIKPDVAAAAARTAAFLNSLRGENKAVADTDGTYRNLLKTLKEKLLVDEERTEVARLQLAIDALSAKQLESITPARQKELEDLAKQIDLNKLRKEQMENDAKNEDALTRARMEGAQVRSDADAKRIAAYDANQRTIEQLQFETQLIGLSNIEREQAIAVRALETMGITAQDSAYAGLVARLREAVAAKVVREDAMRGWETLWSSVESMGKSAFVHVLADGKTAFESIGKAIKASVIDLLYEITAKRWIISMGASVAGAAGIPLSAAQAASVSGDGSGAMNMLGMANNLGAIFGGPSLTTAAGNIVGAFSTYSTLVEGGATAMGALSASTAGLGMSFATMIPYVGLAIGALQLLGAFDGPNNNADPAGPPDQFRTMFSANRSGLTTPAGYSYQGKRMDGGEYSDNTLLAAQDAVMVNNAVIKLFADYEAAAIKAGLSTEALSREIETAHSSALTGSSAQDTYGKALMSLSDNIAAALIPGIENLQLVGESLSQTFARLTGATEAEQARIAAERYGIETQLLQLQGETATLRARELAQIDASNRALQEQIYVAEDLATATAAATQAQQAATRAQEEAARAAQQQAQAIQQARQAVTGSESGLRGALGGLSGQLGIDALRTAQNALATSEAIAPMERLAAAQRQLDQSYASARGGDLASVQAFPQALQSLLTIGRDVYASGPQFQQLFVEGNRQLNDLLATQQNAQNDILKDIPLTIQESAANTVATLKVGFRDMKEELQGLRAEVRRLEAAAG